MDWTPYVIIVVSAIAYGTKDIIKVTTEKIKTKILKKDIDVKKHPIFQKINNYLDSSKYTIYTQNNYKQAVIMLREKIFWSLILENFITLSNLDFSKITNEEYNEKIKNAFDNIDKYTEIMVQNGVSEKTIFVIESTLLHLRVFINSLVNSIKNDNIYDNKKEKTWAIFTAYFEYLDFAHKSAIDLLVKANGTLHGEKFNDLINEGD